MTVQGVTYYRTACDRANCTRHSGNVGRTEAFPSPDAALDDWLLHGGTVDPATGVTLCDYCQPQSECFTCGREAASGIDEDGDPACPAHEAPAPAEPPPVPQADGHPDPLLSGPGAPETAGAR